MGDMAEYALQRAAVDESLLNDYLDGLYSEEDAQDFGITNGYATLSGEALLYAEQREIPTRENINKDIKLHSTQLQVEISKSNKIISNNYKNLLMERFPNLTWKAICNLFKDKPTCNICEKEMSHNVGPYGKFYFCPNRCSGQKPVSETYWLKMKSKIE